MQAFFSDANGTGEQQQRPHVVTTPNSDATVSTPAWSFREQDIDQRDHEYFVVDSQRFDEELRVPEGIFPPPIYIQAILRGIGQDGVLRGDDRVWAVRSQYEPAEGVTIDTWLMRIILRVADDRESRVYMHLERESYALASSVMVAEQYGNNPHARDVRIFQYTAPADAPDASSAT